MKKIRLPSCFARSLTFATGLGSKKRSHRVGWDQAAAWFVLGLLASAGPVAAQTVSLGGAQNFSILGGSTVTNTGPTVITGNVGVSPGSAVTGFPPGVVTGGALHANDATAVLAHADAGTAYAQVAGEASLPANNLTGQDLGGLTLTPGVYHFNTSAQLTGTLSLNTGGDPNATFHFQIGSTLTSASNSSILLLNSLSEANIFWQVGSSATLGLNTAFQGTILALTSITLTTGASITNGRALALNGAVTLDTNNVGLPIPPATGSVWSGAASNLWSGANWSPDVSGATSGALAPAADVVFSVTGVTPIHQNTILDADTTISSLTVNDPAAVTISGTHLLSINGAGATPGITINNGAGLVTINSNLDLSGLAQMMTVKNAAGLAINGVISGAIGLVKAGSGDLVLTNANTYSGLTAVAAGTLEVDGSIAGNAMVAGGILRGTGLIGGSLLNDAAVNPGRASAPGTLQVAGSFTQRFTGSLDIRLASPASYDRLAIGGAAALNGALNVSYLDGFKARAGDTFTILTAAGGVSSQFASFNDAHANNTILTLGVIYQKNDVLLAFMQGSFAALSESFALTPNELAVARALDQLASHHPSDKLIQQLDSLPLAQLPGTFSLLSPEDFAAIFTAGLALSEVQVGNLERRLEDVRQGSTGFSDSGFAVSDTHGAQNFDGKTILAPDGKSVLSPDGKDSRGPQEFVAPSVPNDPRWGFFISGTGELGDLESTSTARGSSFTTGGVTVGADYRVNRHFVLGVALGYANTSSDLSRGGNLDIDSGKGSLYGTYYDGGFYLNGIVGGGYSSYDTKRRTLGGFARGETDGTDFNALLGTGYDVHLGAFTVGPVASLQFATVGLDSFSEHGALGALRVDSQSQDSLKSAVGLKASYAAKLGRVVLTPEVRAQWQHEYEDSRSTIDAGFGSGRSFSVTGPRIGRDGLLLDAGVSAQLNANVALFVFYTGEIGRENYTVHSVNGGLRLSF